MYNLRLRFREYKYEKFFQEEFFSLSKTNLMQKKKKKIQLFILLVTLLKTQKTKHKTRFKHTKNKHTG